MVQPLGKQINRSILQEESMEARISRFQDLVRNPYFYVMNWVLDELKTPPKYRRMHREAWVFYSIPKGVLKNGFYEE
jgi:hypothetical protein